MNAARSDIHRAIAEWDGALLRDDIRTAMRHESSRGGHDVGFRGASGWCAVRKQEPGGSCTGGDIIGEYGTLDEAFDAVAQHDDRGVWQELVHGIWEIGRADLEGWVRGDWFVMRSDGQDTTAHLR